MTIPSPTIEIVEEYQQKWLELDNYVSQENSLKKLFVDTYPHNTDMDDVLIKVCSLNDFYSTNIFSPFSVAKRIISLDIDERLRNNDVKLVNDIARVNVNNKKEFNFYSFATKYCSHHNPDEYPIYDSYVDKMLMQLKRQDSFYNFRKADLKEYSKYKNILIQFRAYYDLEKFTLKEIDKYLWQAGKRYFSKVEVKEVSLS